MSTVALPGPVVDADWLSLHRAGVRVVDVRWYLDGRSGRAAYEAGHLPGAVFADLDVDLSSPPSREGGRHPLPAPSAFAAAMARLGVGDGTVVVAYDDAGGVTAARLWWMLTVLGEQAAILDGGITSWPGELELESPDIEPSSFTARSWPDHVVASADETGAAASSSTAVVLDARTTERYAGEPNDIDPRFGHIPGARSAPVSSNFAEDAGHMAPAVDLEARYRELGVSAAEETIVYCGSGVSACHDILATQLAGLPMPRLFVGSWSAWGADQTRPVETA